MKSVSFDIEILSDEKWEDEAIAEVARLLKESGILKECPLRREHLYPLTPGGLPYFSVDLNFNRGRRHWLPQLQLLTEQVIKDLSEQGALMTLLAVSEGWGDRLPSQLMSESARLGVDIYLFNLELFERDKWIFLKNSGLLPN